VNSVATDDFWKLYRNLPEIIRRQARKAYHLFEQNPSHPGLSFERLRSSPLFWSVRITQDYRAVGRRHEDTMIWFWIGTHSEFDKSFPA
jgi:hypothetical protein